MRPIRELNRTGRTIAAALALASATVLGSVVLAAVAEAAPKTPTPTITSGPSGTVTSTTATFTFTDSASPVTFQCSLDGASYSACTSPKAYTSLSQGDHTFSVTATTPGKGVSNDATRSWTVDSRPPTVAVTFPTNGGVYNTAGWTGSCSGGGICGTATDASGVSEVTVAILQQSSGNYWSGSGFSSASAVFNAATGTGTWRYGLVTPPDGAYSVAVRAKDALGNTTAPGDQLNVAFVIDTVAPAQPVLTNVPENPTDKTNAQFNWSSTESGLGYRCGLDTATLTSCAAAGVEYKNLAVGQHCFSLVAVDAAGNVSSTATYCWSIILSGGFEITGNAVGLLSPGVGRPVNLVIKNQLNFAIRVTDVAVTLAPTSSNPGCTPAANFVITHSLVGSVTIPANSTWSLQDRGVPEANWPLLTMLNLDSNQDACKNVTFTLNYTGTATKA